MIGQDRAVRWTQLCLVHGRLRGRKAVMGLLDRKRSMEMRGIEMEEMVVVEEEQRKAGREAIARGVREGGAAMIGESFWARLLTASNSSKSFFAKRRLRLGTSLSTRAGVRFQINAAAPPPLPSDSIARRQCDFTVITVHS